MMRSQRGIFAFSVVTAALLLLSVPKVFASGDNQLASCETVNPSGAPISISFSGTFSTGSGTEGQTFTLSTITATFAGRTYGSTTLSDVIPVENTGAMKAACEVFEFPTLGADGNATTSLETEILTALGLQGNLKFTACSFLGGTSELCTLNLPPGTIHTPAGLLLNFGTGTVVGTVTGYVSP